MNGYFLPNNNVNKELVMTNNNISNLLRNLASNFEALAEEFEKFEADISTKTTVLEDRCSANQRVLKDAASLIINNLN